MSERRPQRPIRAHSIVFLAVALLLAFLPVRLSSPIQTAFLSLIWPAQAATTTAAQGASVVLSGLFGSFRAGREVEHLRKQIEQQRTIIATQENTIRRLAEQLREMRALKPFVPEQEIESIIPAEIVSVEISAANSSVVINAGSRKGVKPDSALLCGKVAVGRITQVGPWASRVKLLTEIGHSVRAKIARTGNEGVLEGAGGGKFVLRFIPREAQVKVGDALVAPTSSKYFPAGVVLGEIIDVRLEPSDPSYRITAAPTIDYSSLEDVVVVRRRLRPFSSAGNSQAADEL
jgi:rod shape-determining protein MreC